MTAVAEREATRGAGPPAAGGGSAGALIKEARQRRRRRWLAPAVTVGSALALAAAGVVAAVRAGPGRAPGGGPSPGQLRPPGPAAMPPLIVAWTGSWRIEVLSSRTGRVIRTLARNV